MPGAAGLSGCRSDMPPSPQSRQGPPAQPPYFIAETYATIAAMSGSVNGLISSAI